MAAKGLLDFSCLLPLIFVVGTLVRLPMLVIELRAKNKACDRRIAIWKNAVSTATKRTHCCLSRCYLSFTLMRSGYGVCRTWLSSPTHICRGHHRAAADVGHGASREGQRVRPKEGYLEKCGEHGHYGHAHDANRAHLALDTLTLAGYGGCGHIHAAANAARHLCDGSSTNAHMPDADVTCHRSIHR